MRRTASLLSLAALLGSGCAAAVEQPAQTVAQTVAQAQAQPSKPAAQPAATEAPAAQPKGLKEQLRRAGRGLASWYGAAFHGRTTASGERFDMHALTAAHPWLPFGTLVEVRSLVNGRTVTVRINDRGPFTGQRVIDLSRAAAQALGLVGRGVKPVEIRIAQLPGQGEPTSDADAQDGP